MPSPLIHHAGQGPVPADVPVLEVGAHRRPEDGSCLMEYVSVLAGERFSDRPRCTHPALARVARYVNDTVSDSARARLVPLAPTLLDTGGRDARLAAMLTRVVAVVGLDIAPHHPVLCGCERRSGGYLSARQSAAPVRVLDRVVRRRNLSHDLGSALRTLHLVLVGGDLISLVDRDGTVDVDAVLLGLLTTAVDTAHHRLPMAADAGQQDGHQAAREHVLSSSL